jgi:hypothetical protein
MHVKRVTPAHGTKANGNVPSVELVILSPRTRGARTLEVQLDRAVHVPEAKTVLILLKVVVRADDAFLTAQPREIITRVNLPNLRGRDLKGYRVVVRDEDEHELGEGSGA